MSRFEVRTQQQNEAGVRMIGRGPVETVPEGVSSAGAGGTNVGVAIVSVNTPRVQHALVVYKLMARTPNVIHDFVLASFPQSQPNAGSEVVENFIPADAFPFSFSALAGSPQGIQNAFRIVDLVDGRRALGAIAAAAAGVRRIAFKLLHLHFFFVDIGQQSARGFTIEADGGN